MTPHTPGRRRRRWVRHRHSRLAAKYYMRIAAFLMAAVLVCAIGWRAAQSLLHKAKPADPSLETALNASDAAKRSDFWQRGVLESIDAAAEEAQLDNITGAEMDVDRATSLIETARVEARTAGPDFFELAIASLDGTLRPHSDNLRLVEHVTLARIELAQLRAFLAGGQGQANPPTASDTMSGATLASDTVTPELKTAGAPVPSNAAASDHHVMLQMPRALTAYHVFGPSTAGGDWIDAKAMPERAEILMPPASRLLADNVHVQSLTIEGASQTLDGIHWSNVTFVGTRVRYESGEVDLHNVHFERCTFGFTTDDRGARLATAIALGQGSIIIN